MKIGLSVKPFSSGGYAEFGDKLYEKLREHGYACIDYNIADTSVDVYNAPWKQVYDFLSRQRELARSADIEISQVHGPWRWPPRDLTEEDRRERMEKMKISVRATAALGCQNLVIHPIMPYGISDINTENAQKTWDMNISFMSELLEEAKRYGVTVCLENMPMHNFSLSKPKDILKFVRTVDDPYFKICLDTGHVAAFENLSLADAVRELADEIRVLHVHDTKEGKDLHLVPTLGVIDWRAFANALWDIEFSGVFSLESDLPRELSGEDFEDAGKQLFKIAEEIIAEKN